MKPMEYEQVKTRVEAEDRALRWLVPWLGLYLPSSIVIFNKPVHTVRYRMWRSNFI